MKRFVPFIVRLGCCSLAVVVALSWVRSRFWNDIVQWGYVKQGPDPTGWRADAWKGYVNTYSGVVVLSCWDRESLTGERAAIDLALPELYVPPNTVRWLRDPLYQDLGWNSDPSWIRRLNFSLENERSSDPFPLGGLVGDSWPPPPDPLHTRHWVHLSVPHWFLLLLTLPVPTYRLAAWGRRRRRARRGLCVSCGYDLRASGGAGRCPECGQSLARTAVRPPRGRRAAKVGAGVTAAGAFAAALIVATRRPPPPPPPSRPAAPTELAARPLGNSAQLEWKYAADGASTITIERSTDGVSFSGVKTYVTGGTAGDGPLLYKTVYWYRVCAEGAGGRSDPSNVVRVEVPALLDQPDDFRATVTPSGTVRLTWTDRAVGEAGYEIRRLGTDAGVYPRADEFVTVARVGPDVTEWEDRQVPPTADVHYAVRAFDGDAHSEWSGRAVAKLRGE